MSLCSCPKNSISVGKLADDGSFFNVVNGTFSLYKRNYYYGYGTLMDGLHCFNLDVEYDEFLFNAKHSIGSKRSAHNENFAFL